MVSPCQRVMALKQSMLFFFLVKQGLFFNLFLYSRTTKPPPLSPTPVPSTSMFSRSSVLPACEEEASENVLQKASRGKKRKMEHHTTAHDHTLQDLKKQLLEVEIHKNKLMILQLEKNYTSILQNTL